MSAGEQQQPVDLTGLLWRLGLTVQRQLVPRAEDRQLRAELQALASVLRSSSVASVESSAPEKRHHDALAAHGLIRADTNDPAQSRSQLATTCRTLSDFAGDQAAAVFAYLETDVNCGPAVLLEPPGREASSDEWLEQPASSFSQRSLEQAIRQLTNRPDLTVARTHEPADGFAAQTAIVEVHDRGRTEQVVVRVQPPDAPATQILQPPSVQRLAIDAAASAGLPVPRVLGTTDRSVPGVDGALLITTFIDGEAPSTYTPHGRALLDRIRQREGWDGFIDDLATLHRADTTALQSRLGEAATLAARLHQLERLHRHACVRADPLVELALSWLHSHIGQWGERVLIHGDYRPGNVLYALNGARLAVIDFDLADVGDFHEDLATIMSFGHRDRQGRACGLATDEELLGRYAILTGRVIDPSALAFHTVLQYLRQAVVLEAMVRSWYDKGGAVRSVRALFSLSDWRRELLDGLNAAFRTP